MNINTDRPVMIFKQNNEFGTFYKVGLSKKDVNGNYINGYKAVRFKKDTKIEDRTKIYIKNAFIDFYIKDNKTIDYIFITEFEKVQDTIEKVNPFNEEENMEDLPY